ncbi:hypothetical protein QBC37DRAFT_476391 [Rhypophila decipiens]|uniref:non-specific serine/threonine protein kinase n=1 Tax=Rhypophila decipiens TaxID=261697 RepID=A0AAN6XVF3_9PEZI|nr:hypothetical protein QBC37DRAFT_476391 [Rhypophila decipiens]
MTDQPRSKIIEENPIGRGLDGFHTSFNLLCAKRKISGTTDALGQLDREGLTIDLLFDLLDTLRNIPTTRLLPSKTGRDTLRNHLLKLLSAIGSKDFDFDRIKPLLNAALADHQDDPLIWALVYDTVTESTPPPRPVTSSSQQTPWLRNTSSFANSSEHREYVDNVLRQEFGPMYAASEAFFEDCLGGIDPFFDNGWIGWPEEAKQDDVHHVLSWFAGFTEKLAVFAESYNSCLIPKRRLLARPDKPIAGSVGKPKMDIGFVDDPSARKDSRCRWSQILVPGELKSNPSADRSSDAWLDLGRYAREVLAAQDTRRFVLGFTLCGSLMRIWMFDRLGGIASEQFDINKDGLRFVSIILGFLCMSDEELGFDPTIMAAKGQRFIEIEREGVTERLILDGLMYRSRRIAGRATTCWKAHREEDPNALFVVKDSWQDQERDEEGEFLSDATEKGVVHVARNYHHETVRIRGRVDDVQGNVRSGLDVTTATNYRRRSSSIAGAKRSAHETGAPLPPSKRPCSTSPTKAGSDALPNRIHRRVVLSDYGIPIYKASSREALLAALADCIEGHESLRQKAGLLHRDISIGNLMISKDRGGFLIDLDLAVREQRVGATGAKGKTGTRAFMAIGALLGEQHSFMHDLESFFWVLFWICIHSDGPGQGKVLTGYDKWNFADTWTLAMIKKGTIGDERDFIKEAQENFTLCYQPMVPWVIKLRKAVFPNSRRWKGEDSGLYTQMREILEEARKELAEGPEL